MRVWRHFQSSHCSCRHPWKVPFIRKTHCETALWIPLLLFSEFACWEALFWTKCTELRGRLGILGIPHFMLTGTSVTVNHADLVVPRDLHVTRFPHAPSQLLTAEYARRTSDAFRDFQLLSCPWGQHLLLWHCTTISLAASLVVSCLAI